MKCHCIEKNCDTCDMICHKEMNSLIVLNQMQFSKVLNIYINQKLLIFSD